MISPPTENIVTQTIYMETRTLEPLLPPNVGPEYSMTREVKPPEMGAKVLDCQLLAQSAVVSQNPSAMQGEGARPAVLVVRTWLVTVALENH